MQQPRTLPSRVLMLALGTVLATRFGNLAFLGTPGPRGNVAVPRRAQPPQSTLADVEDTQVDMSGGVQREGPSSIFPFIKVIAGEDNAPAIERQWNQLLRPANRVVAITSAGRNAMSNLLLHLQWASGRRCFGQMLGYSRTRGTSVLLVAGHEPALQDKPLPEKDRWFTVSATSESKPLSGAMFGRLNDHPEEILVVASIGREASTRAVDAIQRLTLFNDLDLRIQVETLEVNERRGFIAKLAIAGDESPRLFPSHTITSSSVLEELASTITKELSHLTASFVELEVAPEEEEKVLQLMRLLPESLKPAFKFGLSPLDGKHRVLVMKGFDYTRWISKKDSSTSEMTLDADTDSAVSDILSTLTGRDQDYAPDALAVELDGTEADDARAMKVARRAHQILRRDFTMSLQGDDTLVVART